jgi:ketosteroid isomerase-like protein
MPSTSFRARGRVVRLGLLVAMLSLAAARLPAQALPATGATREAPSDDATALQRQIAARDSGLFDAFNRCDSTAIGDFFTEDLEFYHDWGGLTAGRTAFVRGFAEGCRKGEIGRRELVPGTMEVHLMRNVGALQLGHHRFFIRKPDGGEVPGSIARFAMLWRQEGGAWRISRVLSFDHRSQ